jgi:membrane protease YdiL (CAAX protease family)
VKTLKAYLLILLVIVATVGFGFFSSFYLVSHFRLSQNWIFPAFCMLVGWVLAMATGTSLRISGGSTPIMLVRLLLGILAGILIQLVFLALGMRRPLSYHAISLNYLYFQVISSLGEEYLFRGALQGFLASRIGSANALPSQLISAAMICTPFAVVHGLNPIIFGFGGFDYRSFTSTLVVGLVAGAFFAKTQKVDSAFGVRVGYNLINAYF